MIFCNRQINIRKTTDILSIKTISAIKSSTDDLVYMWSSFHFGFGALDMKKPVICEYTNLFDVCNSMTGHSPISMVHTYTDEEYSILNDLEAAFNDRASLIFILYYGLF